MVTSRAAEKSTTTSWGACSRSAAPPEEYQYDDRPVVKWKSTNDWDHARQPVPVVTCGAWSAGTSISASAQSGRITTVGEPDIDPLVLSTDASGQHLSAIAPSLTR